jgi:hypothetical protein
MSLKEIDEAEEAAFDAFIPRKAAARRTIADVILDKLRERDERMAAEGLFLEFKS